MTTWPYHDLPVDQQIAIDRAQHHFSSFVEYVGRDEQGGHLRFRPLDVFTWNFVDEAVAAGEDVCVMLPNGFGKTTGVVLRVAQEIGRNPNLLVSVVTDSEDNSSKRVGAIKEIVRSADYRILFPHVALARGRDKAHAFSVRRTGQSPFDTVTGYGVLTGTGARCHWLVMDDPVTFKNAVQEPANREKVYQAIRTTWFSRGQRAREGRQQVIWIQTAYHGQDATARIREDPRSGFRFLIVRAEPPFHALKYETWIRGRLVEAGEFESHLSAAYLQDEWDKQGGGTAAAQSLANRPVDPEHCPFRDEMLRGPRPGEPREYEFRTVYADPAGDASTSKSRDTDWCAVAAIGKHRERGWEIYGFARCRGKPSEQAAFIAQFAVRMDAEAVWQEAVRDDALVEATQRELEERGSPVTVEPDKPTTNKEARIVQALEPALNRGRLSICGDGFPELLAEMVAFPAGAHDDGVDAVASCWLKAAGAAGESDDDRVITLAVLDAAASAERPPRDPEARPDVRIGVAVAGYEGEESAAVVVSDGEVVELESWPGMAPAEAAARIRDLRKRYEVPEDRIHVSSPSLADLLLDEDDLGVDLNAMPGDPGGDWEEEIEGLEPCHDRRSELFWVTRLLLRSGRLCVPRRYVPLWTDLAAPAYKWDRQGRVAVEGPEEFRKRKERAPLLAEALILTSSRSGGSPLTV